MRGRASGNSDEFIREVDEAVRQERWMEIWTRYGAYIVGAVLAIVIGTTAGIGWRNYQESQRLDEARRYAAAEQLLADQEAEKAAEMFNGLADEAGEGMAVIARLKAAAALGEAGDSEAAIDVLEAMADNSADIGPDIGNAQTLYQGLARLLAMQQQFETVDPATLIDEIDAAITPNNPWRHSLNELKAMAQLKAGQQEAARATLSTILNDPTTPQSLGRHSGELLQSLGGPLEQGNETVSQNEGEISE